MTNKDRFCWGMLAGCILALVAVFVIEKVFSPFEPGAEVAPTEAPALKKSSPSSEAAGDMYAAFTFDDDAYLDAIEMQESGGDPNAMGDYDKWANVYRAVGAYQLWKIYVDDFNRIQIANRAWHQATYEDRWDKDKSRRITAVVTSHYADYDWRDKPHTQLQWIETAVRAHKNPTERNMKSTKPYWLKVKARMEEVRIVE